MEYIRLLPKKSLSRSVGQIAQMESPQWFVENLKNWFVKQYNLNMDEAEKPLSEYKSLGALFTRRLQDGARPLSPGLIHPCDGKLTAMGEVEEGELIQTKGITYSINEFLKDGTAAETFSGGRFLTYYLCPTDYHRVHSPVDAEVEQVVHVPGALWPVNPWSVENISQLFAVNERVIFRLNSALGPVAVVMIGATNVGKIEVAFDPDIQTNVAGNKEPYSKTYKPSERILKGSELGTFHMGSSVVVIYPKGLEQGLPEPGLVKLGESL